MKIDLSSSQLDFIIQNIKTPLEKFNCKTFVFGSRVTSSARKFSDVDVLIESKSYSEKLRQKIGLINEALENSNFELKVDIVLDCDLIDEYRDQIESEKVQL